jgi:dipeptidyl aminopeptidase/acylaminoacyl peptidase
VSRARLTAAGGLLALGLAAIGTIAVRTWRSARLDFNPPRTPLPRPPEGMTEVAFRSQFGDELRGWYLPAKNRAAVVLLHGGDADRRQMLDRALALAPAGFGVLAFDLPGSGESTGKVTWGPAERSAIEAALTWLAARPEVDPARLGLLGFSQGAYHAAQEAAADPRAQALVLEGCPASYVEETFREYPRWGPLSRWTALASRWTAGPWGRDRTPLELIGRVAPRPILLIIGTADSDVDPEDGQRLFAAAGHPKELWLMAGADHGNYSAVDPQRYPERLRAFFGRALGR